jgi:hypothetical protein
LFTAFVPTAWSGADRLNPTTSVRFLNSTTRLGRYVTVHHTSTRASSLNCLPNGWVAASHSLWGLVSLSSRTTAPLPIAPLFYIHAVQYRSVQRTSCLLKRRSTQLESWIAILTPLYLSSHRIQYVIAARPGLVPPSYVRSFALIRLFQDSVETCRLPITQPPFSVTPSSFLLQQSACPLRRTRYNFLVILGCYRLQGRQSQRLTSTERSICTTAPRAWTGATQSSGHRLRFSSATSTRHIALFERCGCSHI